VVGRQVYTESVIITGFISVTRAAMRGANCEKGIERKRGEEEQTGDPSIDHRINIFFFTLRFIHRGLPDRFNSFACRSYSLESCGQVQCKQALFASNPRLNFDVCNCQPLQHAHRPAYTRAVWYMTRSCGWRALKIVLQRLPAYTKERGCLL